MDDAQKLTLNQGNPPAVNPVAPQQSGQISQPAQPVGGAHKEMAPLSKPAEYLKPTAESKPELSKEVVELGVEHVDQERPTLSPQVQQAGVTPAKEAVPHHTEPTGAVQLLQTPREELVLQSKAGPVTEAAKWFALFLLRQVDKAAYQKAVMES